MTLYQTRGLEEVWTESIKKVQAHGGEVTRFMKLLTDEGMEKIFTSKQQTLSMPSDLLVRYGFDGEDKVASTGYTFNVHSNSRRLQRASFPSDMEFPRCARSYDFHEIIDKMQEDVLESITLHCLFEGKILTVADIMRNWSSDAVQWASQESKWFYNLMVGSHVFDEVDEFKKLPKYLFKNTITAPRTFAEAFPNINAYNVKKMEAHKKAMKAYEKKMGQGHVWDHADVANQEEFVLSKHLSLFDLGVVVKSCGALAVKQYKHQEKMRARRLALFYSKKLDRFTDHKIEEVIHLQRRKQIEGFLA